jgi:hypothetical protein
MINRTAPDISSEVAFTELELGLLDELVQDRAKEHRQKSLTAYLTKLAGSAAICPRPRSATRQHRNVGRSVSPNRHPTRSDHWCSTCG